MAAENEHRQTNFKIEDVNHMSGKAKISFEQFIEAVDADNKPFVDGLHLCLLENGCKVAFEEKKSGFLASYKIGKPQRALLNFVFRKAPWL